MKKELLMFLVVAVILALSLVVYADGNRWGPGMNYDTSANPESVRKFQKETSTLRDELAAKYVELDREMSRQDYDPARVAAIKKDIIDLETRIQISARKHGVFTRPGGGATGGRTYRSGCGWGCDDCPWWGW